MVLGSNGHVINKDRDDDASITLAPDPYAVIRLDAVETHLPEHLVQLLVPHSTRLLETIDGLQQVADPVWTSLDKALRLLHVHLCIQVCIDEGTGDVHTFQQQVLNRSNGKNQADGIPFGSGGIGLSEVKTRALGVTLCHYPAFVTVNGAICILLDLEDPAGANCFATLRKPGEFPGTIVQERLNLLCCTVNPLVLVWSSHSLRKSAWLRGGHGGFHGMHGKSKIKCMGECNIITNTCMEDRLENLGTHRSF